MLFPRCPKCGGTSETAEPGEFERNNRIAGHVLRRAVHAHPYLKAAQIAATLGREVYKRMPGGGEKRCLNPQCRHRFR